MIEHFHDHIILNLCPFPSSTDVKPMNYYLWGVIESVFNRHPHKTVEALRESNMYAMTNISNTRLIIAYSLFRQHADAVIEADVGFNE